MIFVGFELFQFYFSKDHRHFRVATVSVGNTTTSFFEILDYEGVRSWDFIYLRGILTMIFSVVEALESFANNDWRF